MVTTFAGDFSGEMHSTVKGTLQLLYKGSCHTLYFSKLQDVCGYRIINSYLLVVKKGRINRGKRTDIKHIALNSRLLQVTFISRGHGIYYIRNSLMLLLDQKCVLKRLRSQPNLYLL